MSKSLGALFSFLASYSLLFLLDIFGLGTLYDPSRSTTYVWKQESDGDPFSKLLSLDIHQPNNESLVVSSVLNFTVHGQTLSLPTGQRVNFSISMNGVELEIESGNSFDCHQCGHTNAHLDLSHFRSMDTGIYDVIVYANVMNLREDGLKGANESRDELYVSASTVFYFVKENNLDTTFHSMDTAHRNRDDEQNFENGDSESDTYRNSDLSGSHAMKEDVTVNKVESGKENDNFKDMNNIDEVFAKLKSSFDPSGIERRARKFEAELKDVNWEDYLKVPEEDEIILADNTVVQSEEDRIGSVFKYHIDRLKEVDPDIGKRFRSVSEIGSRKENVNNDLSGTETSVDPDTDDMMSENRFKILGPEANSVTQSDVKVFMMICSTYLQSSLLQIRLQVDDEIFDITPHVREQIPMYTSSMLPVVPNRRSILYGVREVFSVELRELQDGVHTLKAWVEVDHVKGGIEDEISRDTKSSILHHDELVFSSQLLAAK